MSRRRRAWKKKTEVWRNTLRDAVGLPVTFTDDEANRQKAKLPENAIAAARRERLALVFERAAEEIETYTEEGRTLALAQERDRVERELSHIDSPMSTDDSLSLYTVIRAAKPRVVVETGTAAGASALYILRAMERNGGGHLHTVDLVEDDPSIGVMIPAERRADVTMHRGDSLALLPELFAKEGPIDLFLHDSNHVYDHMMAEYELALGAVRPGGVIASHDVLHSNAWRHFKKRHRIQRATEIRNFGVCRVP